MVDCPANLKATPPEIPIAETGDPNAIAEADDWLISVYGNTRRQVLALVACVNRWRDLTSPKSRTP